MTSIQSIRYQRQMVLPEVGPAGQARLQEAKVLCVGAGGLGCPVLLYLAAAGIGKLGIIDPDVVDVSNLQRQVLFANADQGTLKVEVASERLAALNPDVKVETYPYKLDASNARQLLAQYDLVVDGTDNFTAKYLINDAAFFCDLPLVFGSVLRFEGQLAIFWAKHGPCYRCLFPEPPQEAVLTCAEAGVFGALAGTIGSMQAFEVIRYFLRSEPGDPGQYQLTRFLSLDARNFNLKSFAIEKDPSCPLCSARSTITSLREYSGFCMTSDPDLEVSVEMLSRKTDIQLVDVRERNEWEAGSIPGAIHLPLSKLECDADKILPKQGELVLYCQSGVRSAKALAMLKSSGRRRVKHLKGGIAAWRALRGSYSDPQR